MEFLTLFAQVLGFVILVVGMVAFIAFPAWLLADKVDDRWGYGAALTALITWLTFAGSLLFAIIIYATGGVE